LLTFAKTKVARNASAAFNGAAGQAFAFSGFFFCRDHAVKPRSKIKELTGFAVGSRAQMRDPFSPWQE
jgi:hypothetical protein